MSQSYEAARDEAIAFLQSVLNALQACGLECEWRRYTVGLPDLKIKLGRAEVLVGLAHGTSSPGTAAMYQQLFVYYSRVPTLLNDGYKPTDRRTVDDAVQFILMWIDEWNLNSGGEA